jgi:hypothetical protein
MSDEQIAVTPPEVLPCPFCGKKTEMRYVHGQYGYTSDQVKIGCGPCGVEFAEKTEDWEPGRGSFSIRKEAEEKLLRRWNARHPGWAEIKTLRQQLEEANSRLDFIYSCMTQQDGVWGFGNREKVPADAADTPADAVKRMMDMRFKLFAANVMAMFLGVENP